MPAASSHAHVLIIIIIIFLSIFSPHVNEAKGVPVPMEKVMVMNKIGRRKLGGFQVCAMCTCCGGAKGLCLPSPCCYAINCNIPNKPFGFCSFTPKACNCFGCHP